MTVGVIDRPDIGYDDDTHSYTLDGEPVPGVSSIAKIGGDSWGPGSWWGWGIAAEGVAELCASGDDLTGWDTERIRDALKDEGWTPNRKRDSAADRGNSVHHAFERLIQNGEVPDPKRYPEDEAGHVLSLLRWYLHYRPEFEAAEVVVGSRTHRFAGRYDLRCKIRADRLPGIPPHEFDLDGIGYVLCLVDLKTSKSVYPDSQFPQLAGYELASVEMGFMPTDAQFVLRTSPDGSFTPWEGVEPYEWEKANFVRSWAEPEDFLAYLDAYLAVQGIEARDPKVVRNREEAARRRREEDAVENLLRAVAELGGATARELTAELECEEWDGKRTSRVLQRLKAAGRVACRKPGNLWVVTA